MINISGLKIDSTAITNANLTNVHGQCNPFVVLHLIPPDEVTMYGVQVPACESSCHYPEKSNDSYSTPTASDINTTGSAAEAVHRTSATDDNNEASNVRPPRRFDGGRRNSVVLVRIHFYSHVQSLHISLQCQGLNNPPRPLHKLRAKIWLKM